MKQLFIIPFLTLFCVQIVHADRITNYDVTIENPKDDSSDPLTITVKKEWNAETIQTYKYVWRGESLKHYEIWDDGKWHEGKSGHVEWFNAYHRPNKNGYILIKNIAGYEEFVVESISLRDSYDNEVKIQEKTIPASTNYMFWSQDGKHLVIIYNEKPWDESHEAIANFYDIYNGKLTFSKPAKQVDKKKLIPIKDVKN